MTKKVTYIGIDPATVMGIAIYTPETNTAFVIEIKGTPIEQLVYIYNSVATYKEKVESVFVLERLHNFRNAVVTRSLLERSGYIKYSLLCTGYRVEEVSPDMVRAYLNAPGKEEVFRKFTPYFFGAYLSSNHTDALACALYQAHLDGYELNLDELRVIGLVKEERNER